MLIAQGCSRSSYRAVPVESYLGSQSAALKLFREAFDLLGEALQRVEQRRIGLGGRRRG